MTIIELDFNLDDVESSQEINNFEPIPPGDYNAVIEKVEEVFSRNGHKMIRIEFKLIGDTQYRNRKIFNNYNIHHPTDIARNIARRQLTKVACLTGAYKKGISYKQLNTNDLINKTIVLEIGIDENNIKYNEITGYKPSGPLNDNTAERIIEEINSNQLHYPTKPLENYDDIPF